MAGNPIILIDVHSVNEFPTSCHAWKAKQELLCVLLCKKQEQDLTGVAPVHM